MEAHPGFFWPLMKEPTTQKSHVHRDVLQASSARGSRHGPDRPYIFGQTFTFRNNYGPLYRGTSAASLCNDRRGLFFTLPGSRVCPSSVETSAPN